MILETAQVLSTAIFLHSDNHFLELYKPTHKAHPCTIWASQSDGNWKWLYQHLIALCDEYSFRFFNRQHRTKTLLEPLLLYSKYIPEGMQTPFVNCTHSEKLNTDFRHLKNTHQAYIKYLSAKWAHDKNPRWTKRSTPLDLK